MKKYFSFYVFAILLIVFSGSFLMHDAFAASPLVSAVANDPDDGDVVFSADDTVLITFPAGTNATNGGTMTSTEFNANFTTTTPATFDGTFTGTWQTPDADGPTQLLLTWTAIVTNLVVSTTTIGYDAAGGNIFYGLNDTAGGAGTEFATTAVTLSGDFGIVSSSSSSSNGGSGCSGDCEEPTIGVDSKGKRHVSNGFTYNGHSVDVERFFTPYPLITADVGKTNLAEFKIYENLGPQNIRHFTFAFGLAKGDVISESKAKIELDIAFDGTETITVTDPENVLDNIKVTTSTVSCMEESNSKCLDVKIQHRFRAPLDFNIVATDVWDTKRSSWQNYYNHGIEVIGDSLNPPNEYDGIFKGHIYHLIETSKTTSVDEFGNSWTLKYGIWEKDFVKNERIRDTASVFTRTHSDFTDAKITESNKAIKKLLVLCPTCLDSFTSLDDPKSFLYPKRVDRANDPQLQHALKSESERATKIVEYILHPTLYYR